MNLKRKIGNLYVFLFFLRGAVGSNFQMHLRRKVFADFFTLMSLKTIKLKYRMYYDFKFYGDCLALFV